MTSGLPTGYHVQAACSTCRYRFEYTDYDIGIDLFCTVDGSARPKCGSLALHETIIGEEMQAWKDWSEARAVVPSGLCPQYKEAS